MSARCEASRSCVLGLEFSLEDSGEAVTTACTITIHCVGVQNATIFPSVINEEGWFNIAQSDPAGSHNGIRIYSWPSTVTECRQHVVDATHTCRYSTCTCTSMGMIQMQ